MRTRLSTLLLVFSLVAAIAAAAEPAPHPLPSREERLAHLGRLWGQVRYRHPALAYRDIDWDAALVDAIPRVEAAETPAAYAEAVQGMLDVLKDSATRVLRSEEEKPGDPLPQAREQRSWEGGREVLVVDLRTVQTPAAVHALRELPADFRRDLSRAKAVIIDLRSRGLPLHGEYRLSEAFGHLLPHLLTQPLRVPGMRGVLHSGFRSQSGIPSGYTTSLVTEAGEVIEPEGRGRPRPVVLLLDERSYVEPRMLAMQARGLLQLVSEGELDAGAAVPRARVELGGGLTAVVRLSELPFPLRADAEVARRSKQGGRDVALQKALELARKPGKRTRTRPEQTPTARWRPDRKYEEMLYPSREHRLLALFRLWNTIHFFYPYKHLLDRSWDDALATFLPRFEQAEDAAGYALAVAEMSTLIQDGHTYVRFHPELEKRGLEGVGAPFVLMDVEGKPVVVEVHDAEAAPGLAPGQVVESIDGKPLEERLRELEPYVTASHAAHRRLRLLRYALTGPEGSESTLGVRDASGKLLQVRFTRSRKSLQKENPGEAYRVLEGNIGYADLTRLQVADVEPMFEKLKSTRALILDMRGYPNGTAWALTPYLNTRGARYGAVFERNLVSGEDETARYKFFQELPRASVPLYRGRTVMLIDERAISQAEHTGLFLEAANGTTFIGSPTAGANGDITNLLLPGGISVTFTGHDVRHVDGAQLQRVGLRPHVYVRPTLDGLRTGRDEVLERALRYLKERSSSADGSTW